nr:hypothetical protein DM860_011449 [Ipomoea batatas]
MATAITNMSGAPLPYPSHGRLRIRTITRVRMPRSSVALGDNCFEIHFNPLFHLTSLGGAFSFFLDRLAGLGANIVFPIAAFAFDLVRSRNWFYGVSLSVDLETVSVLEEPMRSADFLDGEMILNDDTAAARDYYEQLDDLMLQPFASIGHGMSQQEISMLKTERLSDDEDEDGESTALMNGSHHLYLAAYVSRDDDDDFALHPVVAAAQLGRARIRGYGYGWTSSLKHLTEAKAERSTRSSSTVEDTLSIALFLDNSLDEWSHFTCTLAALCIRDDDDDFAHASVVAAAQLESSVVVSLSMFKSVSFRKFLLHDDDWGSGREEEGDMDMDGISLKQPNRGEGREINTLILHR